MCCVSLFVIVISNQSTSKKPHLLDLSKLDALLHKIWQGSSGTDGPGHNMCRSIISLNKMTHQMWHHHPFSQGDKEGGGGRGF